MLYRIEAGLFPHLDDTIGRKTAASIREALGIPVKSVRTIKVFTLEGLDAQQVNTLMAKSVLHDPVLQAVSLSPLPLPEEGTSWIIEVGYRPGVTDNEGRTARDTAALVLGCGRDTLTAYTSAQYHLWGVLSRDDAERVARDLLANDLIQRYRLKSREEWAVEPGFAPQTAAVTGVSSDAVDIVPLSTMDDDALTAYSRAHTLALSLTEMKVVKEWFGRDEVRAERATLGLGPDPTDAEVEVLAQTWSEHCKHKIFAARIHYEDTVAGKSETIDSLYKTYIQAPTATIRKRLGEHDFCRSVFSDNAGVVAFNDEHDVCIKVETHNSPSALDPYGGALTGIVGATNVLLEQDGGLTQEQRQQLLRSTNEDAQWLIRIVENLLSITRISSEEAKVKKEPEPAEEVIESAVAKTHKHYPEVDIRVHLPDELMMVPMDPLLMEQVLVNLMENAVIHGETHHIDVTLSSEGNCAVFTVADDGRGIPQHLLPRLFDGSARSDRSSDGKRSMGIGLSVCRTIVLAHGGVIRGDNRQEGGAVFTVTLPMKGENDED